MKAICITGLILIMFFGCTRETPPPTTPAKPPTVNEEIQ